MIIFRYKEESLGLGQRRIKRPIADVYLRTKKDLWLEFHPYIDSGADLTMIPLSLGKLIGLEVDESKIQQIGGIRGNIPVIHTERNMKIGDKDFTVSIAWALIEDVPPLLGRKDVFDIFKVTFEQYKGVIVFDEIPKTNPNL